MDHKMRYSLRMKFVAVFCSFFFLQGILQSWFFIVREKSSLKEDLQQRGMALSKNLAYNSSYGVVVGDSDTLMGFLPGLIKEPDVSNIIIMGMDGKVLAHSQKDQIGKTLSDVPATKALSALTATAYEYRSDQGENYYDIISPVYTKNSENKIGVVRVELSLKSLEQKLRINLLLSLGLTASILLIGSCLAFLFIRKVIRPIEHMALLATKIADGDFTQTINVNSQDEIGVLGGAFAKMSGSLNSMVKNIREVTFNLAAASEQIKNNSLTIMEGAKNQSEKTETSTTSVIEMDSTIKEISANVEGLSLSAETTSSSILELSASFEEVAKTTANMVGSVDETAASIIEMNSAIKEVVQNIESLSGSAAQTMSSVQEINASVKEVENHAKDAASLSEKVTADAEQLGMTAIEKTINGMDKIKESVQTSVQVINKLGQRSTQIGKILTVIDQVTKQTNLLALNAAILAAQAGEQGKGFAVVANEIKNLADQTSGSTHEISQLISDVQKEVQEAIQAVQSGVGNVETGIQLSLNAREALKSILKSSNLSSTMANEIEKATGEQSRQIKQITQAIEQINGMILQISTATMQQKKGSDRILQNAEKMRDSTRGVQKSTQEQSKGSRQITDAMGEVTERVRHISNAIKEQKKGTEVFMGTMEGIRKVSKTSLQLSEEMSKTVEVLTSQTTILKNEVDRFKV
ncbi:MAG: HAMP domain-containing protein [Nitrospirae bacterium]|nr:HAMP domain-containing protein [Nitrospirota bacterium]MBI3352499.1 HAMP domain-containing protein [Nitrospirota bacterium]